MRNPYQVTSQATTDASAHWRPVPWIAALTSLFVTPLGMLYVQRPWWALAYLVASIAAGLAAYFSLWAVDSVVATAALSLTSWGVAITCAIHSYRIANAEAPSRRKWYSQWYCLGALPLSVFLIFFLVRSFAFEPYRVPSESMHPTIPEGSIVLVSKAGFGHYGTYGIPLWRADMTQTIARGDIVLYRPVTIPDTNYISRIVAMPGDHIEYVNRRLAVNGRPMPMQPGRQEGMYQYAVERIDDLEVTVAFLPERPSKDLDTVVPADQYVVLSDNRDNARDSRYVGLVPEGNIVGRIVKVLQPGGLQSKPSE